MIRHIKEEVVRKEEKLDGGHLQEKLEKKNRHNKEGQKMTEQKQKVFDIGNIKERKLYKQYKCRKKMLSDCGQYKEY